MLETAPCRLHTILTDDGIQFAAQPRNRTSIGCRPMPFDTIREANGIAPRLTKPPCTTGQGERRNRTILDATVNRFHERPALPTAWQPATFPGAARCPAALPAAAHREGYARTSVDRDRPSRACGTCVSRHADWVDGSHAERCLEELPGPARRSQEVKLRHSHCRTSADQAGTQIPPASLERTQASMKRMPASPARASGTRSPTCAAPPSARRANSVAASE